VAPLEKAGRAEEGERKASPEAPAAAAPQSGGMALSRRASQAARFEGLLAVKPGSASEARALRESWRAFAAAASGPLADDARVEVVLAGAQAYRFSRAEEDLEQVRRDARAYLERPDARQKARVRELLDSY
jgi:hypothetical protein